MVQFTRARCLSVLLLVAVPALAGCDKIMPGSSSSTSGVPDPNNELPQGMIDNPKDTAVVPRDVELYGWALDDQGVSEVRLFIDGRYQKSVTLTESRPDVAKAYPIYTSGKTDKVGWAATLKFSSTLAAGSDHTIIAQAVDLKGATRDIGAITVTIGQ